MSNLTKEERFLVALYEIDKEGGLVSIQRVAENSGVGPKSCRGVCKTLMRTNFIRILDDEFIKITPHGVKLAEQLFEP
ncbi:MAG: hypothetical protein KDK48_04320 [Chlamydiia bacterium]|nr:hypothetical protein [Chlamydiia bacterium]